MLADCLSLESEWQQVSSRLQDSPEYSSRSYQSSHLYGVDFFQAFGDHSKRTNFNWYHCHPHVPLFCSFCSQAMFKYFSIFVLTFIFILWSTVMAKSTRWRVHYYYYYYYYYYYSLIRVFHISVSRWFFTGFWVTASLPKSPGLFSVFWPFSIMLSFGWSPPVHQLPTPPVPLV